MAVEMPDPFARAQEALTRFDFAAAADAFREALQDGETAEALEGLAQAAVALDDGTTAVFAAERAYALYRHAGEDISAARMATSAAGFTYLFRDQVQVASGWLHRARALLKDTPLCAEHGYLAAEAGFQALQADHDVVRAGVFGAEAAACGRALGIVDLAMYGSALEGLARVTQGRISEGMALLDEAGIAATNGEVADPGLTNVICCYLIYACEWVHDFDRAATWCQRLREFCERVGVPSFLAICRTHYAGMLMWRGDWEGAEAELAFAREVLARVYPALVPEGHARLGELRRRQGRWDEAAQLFAQSPNEPRAMVGQAALALDRGDPVEALDRAERLLRRLPAESQIERLSGLDTLARALIAAGDGNAAREAIAEMWRIARAVETAAARGRTLAAEGLLALATGHPAVAVPWLEDAADLFDESGGRFEAASARIDLARALLQEGRAPAALRELDNAEAALAAMGAGPELSRAQSVRGRAGPTGMATPLDRFGLSVREREVLALLVEGLSNAEMADRLVLSVRTIERHLGTIYEKLEVGGRNARSAAISLALRGRSANT